MTTTPSVSDYQILDPIAAVRHRPGMYVGDVKPNTQTTWVFDNGQGKMVNRELTYIPAIIKIFSEILDNAIDEYKRAPNVMDTIRVTVSDKEISVADNGRGIPVEIHPVSGKYVAETIFTTIHAGSNFKDEQDQQLAGTNGLGSTATCILSTVFSVESCDGKKMFRQTYRDGLRTISEPQIRANSKNGTTITFTPDFAYFGIPHLDDDHQAKFIKRVMDAAACNPGIKFYLNGERVQIKSFSDYIHLYTDEFVIDVTPDWTVAVAASDGFEQVSFVNSIETYTGGTHIDYVANQIVSSVREHIKKKHKVDVKPSDIKSHLRVFISASINRPKFNSQTKEFMTSQVSEYKTSWSAPDKFIGKILKSDIIQSVLSWAKAKEQAAIDAEMAKKKKELSKTNPKHVDKFTDANSRNERHKCEMYITEGLSALNSIQSARGKSPYIGAFALKGTPKNVYNIDMKKVHDTEEFANFLIASGLYLTESGILPEGDWVMSNGKLYNENDMLLDANQTLVADMLRVKVSPTDDQLKQYEANIGITHVRRLNARFSKFIILSDYDNDGHHIAALMFSFFAKFWPELFKHAAIYRFNTPLYIATVGKQHHEFFMEEDYLAWAKTAPKHKVEYYKGLGTFATKDFSRFIQNPEKHLVRITALEAADFAKLNLAFNDKIPDARKTWLAGANYFKSED
jgi:DNA topoisomerase-2